MTRKSRWHENSTRWLYCVECHNTVFGSKRSDVYAQAVCFLHSTMRSVTCLRLSDVSVICRVTYFQFQSAFLTCRYARRAAMYWLIAQYRTSDVARIWAGTFLVRGIQRRDLIVFDWFWINSNFKLILVVKLETKHERHTMEGYFGIEFRQICNPCGIMVAWSRNTLKSVKEFLAFFCINDPLR